jgi:hypothetical protein
MFFWFPLCSQCVLPSSKLCSSRVLPIAPHFYPLGFAQSSPLLVCVCRWAKGETLHLHVRPFILGSFKSFNFFFFLLDNDPIKMGPHLINRSNNHRHKCVWASPTIFPEIWIGLRAERERKKKKWSNILV